MLQVDNSAKGKPLLHFHGNNEHIFIADSYIYLKSNKKGTYFRVSMAIMVTRIRHIVTVQYTVYLVMAVIIETFIKCYVNCYVKHPAVLHRSIKELISS